MRPRILLVAPTPWDLPEIERLRGRYEFIFEEVGFYGATPLHWLVFDVRKAVRSAVRAAREHRVSGIIGTHDYPSCLIARAACAELGLPAASPERVTRASHKFLSRSDQRAAVPEAVPPFHLFDPLRWSESPPPLPSFIKPVKSSLSVLAAEAREPADLERLLRFNIIERAIGRLVLRPFQDFLDDYAGGVRADLFIAEGILPGAQATVEWFADEGRGTPMGVVDSIFHPGTISFKRFEYPSRLPPSVQHRMEALAVKLGAALGLDHGCFNAEMAYDATADRIGIIEVNPRMASQFADLHAKVDGTSTYSVEADLAVGRRPVFRRAAGAYGAAASFALRIFSDARVLEVPSLEARAEILRRFPDTRLELLCRPGQRLSRQPQDMHSFRYALVNMGASDAETLRENFTDANRLFQFRFRAV